MMNVRQSMVIDVSAILARVSQVIFNVRFLRTMTDIEYAQKILDEYRPGEIALDVWFPRPLSCIILCKSGKRQEVNGKWAVDMLKLQKSNTDMNGDRESAA